MGGDGFRIKKSASKQGLLPVGQISKNLSSPLYENNPLCEQVDSDLQIAPSRPTRGAYHDRRGRRVRDAVDAAVLCARIACRRTALKRTVKSCGSDAAVLASSCVELFAQRRWQKSRSPGRSRISRKAIARGRPDALRWTCTLVCTFLCALRTRDRGCSAHPVFPAPSTFTGRMSLQTSDASRRENEMSCRHSGAPQRGEPGISNFRVRASHAPE